MLPAASDVRVPAPFAGAFLIFCFDYDGEYLSEAQFRSRYPPGCSPGPEYVASVTINGHAVLSTDNMFHRIRVDVRRFLHAGNNHIRVDFKSKVKPSP